MQIRISSANVEAWRLDILVETGILACLSVLINDGRQAGMPVTTTKTVQEMENVQTLVLGECRGDDSCFQTLTKIENTNKRFQV
jgi:hypothetical protein